MNNIERDRVVFQLLDPRTGAEIGACFSEELPAKILAIVQNIGQAPRIRVFDAQKGEK